MNDTRRTSRTPTHAPQSNTQRHNHPSRRLYYHHRYAEGADKLRPIRPHELWIVLQDRNAAGEDAEEGGPDVETGGIRTCLGEGEEEEGDEGDEDAVVSMCVPKAGQSEVRVWKAVI